MVYIGNPFVFTFYTKKLKSPELLADIYPEWRVQKTKWHLPWRGRGSRVPLNFFSIIFCLKPSRISRWSQQPANVNFEPCRMSDIFWSNWPFKVLIKKGYSLCKKWNFKVNFEVVMHPPSIFVVYYIFCPPPWPDAKKNHCYDFRHTGSILRSKIFRVGI